MLSETVHVNGPMHALGAYLQDLWITWHVGADGKIYITTPLGATIDLCTEHLTHISSCIRETCRYTILKKLLCRLTGSTRKQATDDAAAAPKNKCRKGKKHKIIEREDMVGISAHTNVHATLAFTNASSKVAGIDSASDLLNTDADGKLLLPIWKTCRLMHKSMRRLLTIVAGSIRPPTRMVHAGRVASNLCSHPTCKGTVCNAVHVS